MRIINLDQFAVAHLQDAVDVLAHAQIVRDHDPGAVVFMDQGVEGLDSQESALGDGLSAVRVSACMLLAWSRHPRAGEVLLRAFQTESDSQTRAQILTNAVHLSSPVAETLVQEALDSTDTLLHKTAEFLGSK